MTNAELVTAAVAAGWRYSRVLLYDHEGVEGFAWEGPEGQETFAGAVDGDWRNGPEVPHEVRLTVDESYRSDQAAVAAKKREFAQFLANLMGSER